MMVHEMEFEQASGAGPDADDLDCCGQPLNCYALVAYLPSPLGPFLDDLRRDLETCKIEPRAHVTLLPPRPLADGVGEELARLQLDRSLTSLAAFEIEAAGIEVFSQTNVVYASIRAGYADLIDMHGRLNQGRLYHREPFDYHPHITLAQGLEAEQAEAVRKIAQARWNQFRGSRRFVVDNLTFVRNLDCGRWVDLAAFPLPSPVLR